MNGEQSQEEASFGVVPLREDRGETLVLVIRHNSGHWGFPKGHAVPGESPQAAALRELAEETGLQDVELLASGPLTECYSFRRRQRLVHKTVTYFIGWCRSREVRIQHTEVQDWAWLSLPEALPQLTFEEARQVLRQAQELLAAAPPPAAALSRLAPGSGERVSGGAA